MNKFIQPDDLYKFVEFYTEYIYANQLTLPEQNKMSMSGT